MRVFLDTNILLDVLLNRPGLAADSEAVILRCDSAGDAMYIAWHGLATAYYLLKRGRTEACQADFIITRNTSDFAKSKVVPLSPQDFLKQFPQA